MSSVSHNKGGRRPRVLFISFKLGYISPTRQLFHAVLSKACDLTTFGPGYVSLDEVYAGPERYIEGREPFDIVVADEFSMLRDALPAHMRHLHQFCNQASNYDPLLIHEGTRYFQFLKNFQGPRVISLLASDYYSLRPDLIDQFEEAGDFYVTWGREFIKPKSSIDEGKVAGQPQNAAIYRMASDNYFDFVLRNNHRIISTPHFVDDYEFNEKPLRARRYDWSVLGADYESRVKARALLDGVGQKRSGRFIPYMFAGFSKIGFHPYNKFWAIDLLTWNFRRALAGARFGFTCGSILQWPIRKYFEIPASGAVLAAEHCNGFKELGFIDKVNALEIEPEGILDAHAWLSADVARAQAIASAGQRLVREKHTVAARARQIAAGFERIMSGTFAGSFWRGGELHFADMPSSSRVVR